MKQLYHATELIGIKDKNITLTKVFQHETHIEVQATLDYTPPKCSYCHGNQIKYDFQKPSKIPFIEIGGLPSLICLKKRRFQCNHPFKIALTTFIHYQKYITNAIKLPYSNAKLEATNKLIKDIKRNAFSYRNFDNFKKRIYIALNSKKARTSFVLARA